MLFRSEPNTLTTIFPRTPLTASSTLSLIGCEKLKSIPGISLTTPACRRSAAPAPGATGPLGLRRANTLAMFMPSLSSPSSG